MYVGCVLAAAYQWVIDAIGLRWVASQVTTLQAAWDEYEASYYRTAIDGQCVH
jgi:hypothetical protein